MSRAETESFFLRRSKSGAILRGTPVAIGRDMSGWMTVDEIVAYQLSVRLRDEIVALVETGRFATDFKFRDQMRDAARSAPRNISEGFYRYNHGEFAYHASVAKASLGELKTHLEDARTSGYITEERFTDLYARAKEAMATTSGLLKYLRSSKAPKVWLKDRA